MMSRPAVRESKPVRKLVMPTVGAGTASDPLKPKYDVKPKNVHYRADGTVLVEAELTESQLKELLKKKDVKEA